MSVALAVLVGFLAGRLVWLLLRPSFAAALFLRENYRGHVVPTAAGIVLPVTVLGVEAAQALDEPMTGARWATVVVALGMGLVGLLDDLAGDGGSRGFRGHVAALARGRLTTGAVKLFGGGAVAVVAVSLGGESVGQLLADAALVALAANLGNLFDRAPGRAVKVGVVAFAAVAAAAGASSLLVGPAVVVGAAAALLLDDLHERLMVGDTGANVLGGVVGLGVVLTCAASTRVAVLVALVVLNAASEVVSFSRVIEAVPPLRALDRAGRLRA